jgi:hypothetical protein
MNKLIAGIITFVGILWAVFSMGKKTCEIKAKEENIIVKELVIKEKENVNKRRIEALRASPDDNLLWLEANICEDCR